MCGGDGDGGGGGGPGDSQGPGNQGSEANQDAGMGSTGATDAADAADATGNTGVGPGAGSPGDSAGPGNQGSQANQDAGMGPANATSQAEADDATGTVSSVSDDPVTAFMKNKLSKKNITKTVLSLSPTMSFMHSFAKTIGKSLPQNGTAPAEEGPSTTDGGADDPRLNDPDLDLTGKKKKTDKKKKGDEFDSTSFLARKNSSVRIGNIRDQGSTVYSSVFKNKAKKNQFISI